jgi:D-galactarolactone cycloisomerase
MILLMKIVDVKADAISYPVTSAARLSIGRLVKRDAVVVKVTTESGLAGYGEAHHGRAAGAIAYIVNTTVRDFVIGENACDVIGIWSKLYSAQLKSHGLGAATAMAMSGVDCALWDIRAKSVGWPLYRLLGGGPRSIKAYAGGVSLGWQEPASLVEEALSHIQKGYRAIKLRVGDTPANDLARTSAVRAAVGADIAILVDANTGYTLDDMRAVAPAYAELGIGWIEEPFAAHDHQRYIAAAHFVGVPLAAGENHYTRYEFSRLIEDRVVSVLQPDISKAGGITETLRIAALGSTWKLPICPHTSMTGLNMAATIHLLASIDNCGYFEGDVSPNNLFRDQLVSTPYQLAPDGTVCPNEGPGIGVEVDEDFIRKHPLIPGPPSVDIKQ